jgi:hypothetical protein
VVPFGGLFSLERDRVKYSDKLKDPRWQRKRLEVMDRDGWACLCCGDNASMLHVHHKEYHGNPWDACMDSLETLCEKCHEARSSFNKTAMAADSGTVLNFIDGVFELDLDGLIAVGSIVANHRKKK